MIISDYYVFFIILYLLILTYMLIYNHRRITALEIIYTKSYDNSIKKIKKHYKEIEELNRILKYLKNKNSFDEIIDDPISKTYGFERLKYEYSEFYSFRL